jgi:CheY-like chemotaxis protein
LGQLALRSNEAIAKSVLQFLRFAGKAVGVTEPLAIILHERLVPGSLLVNRLQDLNYRVLATSDGAALAETVRLETPLLVFVDLQTTGDALAVIGQIRAEAATAHVPIIAFAPDAETALFESAKDAGANVAVGDSAVTNHLAQLVDRALAVE